jgi:hypothetical protein
LTIVLSVAVFVFVGAYSGRQVKELDDYFVAGRRAPTILIVGTLVASVFSTSTFLGEAGFTYDGQMGPYQRGSGQLLPDGSINWAGAEAWFVFGPGLLFVPLGLISTWVIWRRYRPLDA